jgi:retinoid hydroxylase
VCIGQHFAELEMHILLAMLLRAFTWTLVAAQDLSFTELPTPLPRGGLMLDLRGR